MRAKFFVCIFQDAAKSHSIANVREDMSFEEMGRVMRNEFESDARRLDVHMTRRVLSLEKTLPAIEEVLSDSERLNWLVKRINRLTPQCPEGFRSEENKIQFLRDAVIGKDWASQAISQITTSQYCFKSFVSALREVLQYAEEIRRHKSIWNSPSTRSTAGILCQKYGRAPRFVSKFPQHRYRAPYSARNGNRSRKNPRDRNGKRMLCNICRSDTHLQRFHSESVKNATRDRIAANENPFHIISDLINDYEEICLLQGDEDEVFESENNEDGESSIADALHVFDSTTSGAPERSQDLRQESSTLFVNEMDTSCIRNHINASGSRNDLCSRTSAQDFL